MPACSTNSRPRRAPAMTASSVSIFPMSRSTDRYTKAPYGGEGTGRSPVDRAKLGWKWSLAVDAAGISIGWATNGANRNDVKLLEPTLDAVAATGLLADIDTVCLDRSYATPRSGVNSTPTASTILTSRNEAPNPNRVNHTDSLSGCAGSSKPPTPGGRTTDNSTATPTEQTDTATPHYASQPPC